MEYILELYKFTLSGSCNCAGYKTLKYRRNPDDGYELQWRMRRHLYRLKKYGHSQTNWIDFEAIKTILEDTLGQAPQKLFVKR